MAQMWYFSKGGQKAGPVVEEKLHELARNGEITPQDLVWTEGMPNWAPATTIKNLFPTNVPPLVPQQSPPALQPPPRWEGGSFCRNCGKPVGNNAVACLSCGLAPDNGNSYCPGCGAETSPKAIICVRCGIELQAGKPRRGDGREGSGLVYPSDPPKDPALMCLLSVLIVGLGQIILGQTWKGITYLLGTIIFSLVTCGFGLLLVPIVWIVSGIDAYRIASKLKEGTPVGAWEFF